MAKIVELHVFFDVSASSSVWDPCFEPLPMAFDPVSVNPRNRDLEGFRVVYSVPLKSVIGKCEICLPPVRPY